MSELVDRQIRNLRNLLADHARQLSELKKENDNLAVENSKLRDSKVGSLSKENESLKEQLEEKDHIIGNQKREIAELKNKIEGIAKKLISDLSKT